MMSHSAFNRGDRITVSHKSKNYSGTWDKFCDNNTKFILLKVCYLGTPPKRYAKLKFPATDLFTARLISSGAAAPPPAAPASTLTSIGAVLRRQAPPPEAKGPPAGAAATPRAPAAVLSADALNELIKRGRVDDVRQALEAGTWANSGDVEGKQPLTYCGHRLVAVFPDEGNRPMRDALLEIAALLVQHGARAEPGGDAEAFAMEDSEFLRVLLKHGAIRPTDASTLRARHSSADDEHVLAVLDELTTGPEAAAAASAEGGPGGESAASDPHAVCGDIRLLGLGAAIEPGELIFDRSGPDRGILGSGQFGDVRRAHYRGKRLVAVKTLRLQHSAHEEEEKRAFFDEALTLARCRHANCVHFIGYSLDPSNGDVMLVTELCQGGSLDKLLGSDALAPRRVMHIATLLSKALHFVHDRGFTHGDIKCANVLLTCDKEPKLADFGLSKVTGTLTTQREFAGTFAYMAPELMGGDDDSDSDDDADADAGAGAEDKKKTSASEEGDEEKMVQERARRSDVFALGLVIWAMFAGQEPWVDKKPAQIIRAVSLKRKRPKMASFAAGVTDAAKAIIEATWAHDPLARPTAVELNLLLSAASGSTHQARLLEQIHSRFPLLAKCLVDEGWAR